AVPLLAFTDLTQAPCIGNGDVTYSAGNGAYVTLWGHNLGASQGASTITLGGVAPSSIIYWGNASSPFCGPANLYNQYQKMQSVVFQVDHTTPTGVQDIVVTVNGQPSNAIPITIVNT